MPIYWLDADVYIQAKNGPYPFELVPKFWAFLAEQLDYGTIKSPKMVYEEITAGDDLLSKWAKRRRSSGLCAKTTKDVQDCFKKIANHVHTKPSYRPQQAIVFLNGGDGWVIAHAMATNGIVVTQESDKKKSSKIKVPTVCRDFGIKCINTYEMLRLLGAQSW